MPRRGNRLLVEGQVIGDVQIHIAIAIVVAERAVGSPASCRRRRPQPRLFERAVAVVAKQEIGTVGSDVEILITIVVVVGDADAGCPASPVDAGCARCVRERGRRVFVQGGHGIAAVRVVAAAWIRW